MFLLLLFVKEKTPGPNTSLDVWLYETPSEQSSGLLGDSVEDEINSGDVWIFSVGLVGISQHSSHLCDFSDGEVEN